MTIRFRLLLGFFILILIFIIVFFFNKKLSEEVQTNTVYLSNSEIVIKNSNILHREMIEMQSGFRGFLLTNQESFLQAYYEGLKSIPPLIIEQKRLFSTSQQKVKLDSIYLLHQKWIEYADSLISTKKDTLPESNLKYQKLFNTKLRMEVGKKINDKINTIFASIDEHEYMLRQERRMVLKGSIERTGRISFLLSVASIILAVIASFYFVRTISLRITKMVSLAENISRGSFITIKDDKKDELTQLAESLNKMSETLDRNFEELKTKNNDLDQFAYVVSHDLKAPLRGITNIIDWLQEDHLQDITPEINKNLLLIKGRTERLERMINGLLEYARIGKIKRDIEKIDVAKLVTEIKESIVPKNVLLKIQGDLPAIDAEKLLLEQVFSNLISNAFKHNKTERPEIMVIGKDKNDHYEFSVTDNGPGIEREYFDKIFIIFQTLQERDAFESTGVGLAIVKKIIEDYKGVIVVESELGKGTTFRFTWPKIKTT